MKEIEIEPIEGWIPTSSLRWYQRKVNDKLTITLQQYWRSNFGNYEWRDIEIIQE